MRTSFNFALLACVSADNWKGATTDIAIWSTVEMGLAISAASLATLRPLFKMAAWKLGFSSRQTTSARTPYGASVPHGLGPNSTHGVGTFDNHVYVLSEFTQGTTKVEKYGDWKVGTHTTAYAIIRRRTCQSMMST